LKVSGGGTGMMADMSLPHPIHLHALQFQIIERITSSSTQEGWNTLSDGFVDVGWHDTVLVFPGERVKILVKFEDFTGLYLYHCHNLEHEDMGMMRNYLVEA
jgi:FtsP/CotA-like multicopper oxidase with cupredoxin domain